MALSGVSSAWFETSGAIAAAAVVAATMAEGAAVGGTVTGSVTKCDVIQ